jgi:uncharacterized protein (DUF488 family)
VATKRRTATAVYTIGHSTHSIDDFVRMLRAHGVKRLIDVRTIPKSRHNPQFNGDVLAASLRNRRINYRHMKSLGGLRRARADSPNTGWRNASFRGFADYMQTAECDEAVGELIDLAAEKTSAIMCAEAVPWRCHRSLIADALAARGVAAYHIMSATNAKWHELTPMARVKGKRVTYPAEA